MPDLKPNRSLLSTIEAPVAGILLLALKYWRHTGELFPDLPNSPWHLPPLAVLPIPVAFFFWLRLAMRKTPFKFRFSGVALLASIAGFVGYLWPGHLPKLHTACLLAGVLAGLLVRVKFRDIRAAARRMRRQNAVACAMGCSSIAYYLGTNFLWPKFCYLTTLTSDAMLHAVGIHSLFWTDTRIVLLGVPHFIIFIWAPCSGLEGICAFYFLLSALLLWDWAWFEKRLLINLYVFGFFYMFLVNSLRIAVFFSVGAWAWENTSPLARSMRGWPLELFHRHVGWVFYLSAFALFMVWLYRVADRNTTDK